MQPDRINLPLTPPGDHRGHRARARHAQAAYRAQGRLPAICARLSYLSGRVDGTLRLTRRGDRRVNLRLAGRPIRRARTVITLLAIVTAELADLALVAAMWGGAHLVAAEPNFADIGLTVNIVLLTAAATAITGIAARHVWRRHRLQPPPPRPARCVFASDLAHIADASPMSLAQLAVELSGWLDIHQLTLRVHARPALAGRYQRAMRMQIVGYVPALFGPNPLVVLERRPAPRPQA